MALQRLREAAEKAKMELSTVMETEINLPFISAGRERAEAPPAEAHAGEVRAVGRGPAAETVGPVKQALADAGLQPAQVHEVVLVGGSTRIPRVQQIVRDLFGKEPHKA